MRGRTKEDMWRKLSNTLVIRRTYSFSSVWSCTAKIGGALAGFSKSRWSSATSATCSLWAQRLATIWESHGLHRKMRYSQSKSPYMEQRIGRRSARLYPIASTNSAANAGFINYVRVLLGRKNGQTRRTSRSDIFINSMVHAGLKSRRICQGAMTTRSKIGGIRT